MTTQRRSTRLLRPMAVGIVTGILAALATVTVLKLLGVDASTPVIGGVVGAVVGSIAPAAARCSDPK